MDTHMRAADRNRMKKLLSATKLKAVQARATLRKQAAIVARLENRGYSAELARGLHLEMAKFIDALCWQQAWIEQALRTDEFLGLTPQPHPWAEAPPPDLLRRICVEMQRIVRDDPEAKDPVVTNRAVRAAIDSAAHA